MKPLKIHAAMAMPFLLLSLASCQSAGPFRGATTQPYLLDIQQRLANADLDKLVGTEITIQGQPHWDNFSTVYASVQGRNQRFFLNQLSEDWPPGLPPGAEVRVTGILARRKIIDDAMVTDSGEVISNGSPGEQYLIDHPRWEPVDPHVVLKPKLYSIKSNATKEVNFDPMVGHLITVEGWDFSQSLKFGASVVTHGSAQVYVDGVTKWPPEAHGRLIRVTGTLTVRYDRPRVVQGPYGEALMKFDGPRFILTGAKYEFLDVPNVP